MIIKLWLKNALVVVPAELCTLIIPQVSVMPTNALQGQNLNLNRFQFAVGFQRDGISGYYGINLKDFSLNLAHTVIRSKLTNSGYMEHSISLQYNIIDRRIKSIQRNTKSYDFRMF